MFLAQIHNKLLHGQDKVPRILSWNDWNDLEDQGQWPLFSIPAESIPECMFGANIVIPAQICDKLSRGQPNFLEIWVKWAKWPLFFIPAKTIPGCMFGANLLIQAQICDELSCRQDTIYGRMHSRTDGRTDGQTQATTIPLRPERPQGNKARSVCILLGVWCMWFEARILSHARVPRESWPCRPCFMSSVSCALEATRFTTFLLIPPGPRVCEYQVKYRKVKKSEVK